MNRVAASRIRVLLIEDDENDYILARGLLARIDHGEAYQLDWTASYEVGLADVRAGRHDVYLLDYRLGAHDGLQLLREAGPPSERAPIILLTGQGDRQVDLQAMHCGAADYLVKDGLDARQLERSIRYALERRQHEEALQAALAAAEAARRDLVEANRAKGRFLATMAHEFRTPLQAILGFSDLLLEDAPSEAVQASLEHIQEAGGHLLHLVNDLVDLSRIEAGHLELDRSTFDLGAAIHEACETVAPLAEARGLHLLPPEGPLGVLQADATRFHQVLLNLLSNAIKYTPAGGTVQVDVTRGDGDVRVSVRDTGVGIAVEDQARIFEPYVRVHPGAERRESGVGLGLALVRLLTEAHGGRIEVDSEPGKGSCFSVFLPEPEPSPGRPDPRPALREEGTVRSGAPRRRGELRSPAERPVGARPGRRSLPGGPGGPSTGRRAPGRRMGPGPLR